MRRSFVGVAVYNLDWSILVWIDLPDVVFVGLDHDDSLGTDLLEPLRSCSRSGVSDDVETLSLVFLDSKTYLLISHPDDGPLLLVAVEDFFVITQRLSGLESIFVFGIDEQGFTSVRCDGEQHHLGSRQPAAISGVIYWAPYSTIVFVSVLVTVDDVPLLVLGSVESR